MTTPTLSIVVPTYNAASTLDAQLRALADSIDDDTEVLVVDNRSTDGSREVAERFARSDLRFRVVDATERQGEPHARNVGVIAARADAVAFCDADDVVAPGWAAAMRTALCNHDFVTGPADVDRLNPGWLADARGRRLFSELAHTVDGIPFAHGCNFGIRRSAFDAVGGFDETWLIGCDVEFAIRLHRAGIQLAWHPDALVHYRHRPTWRGRWRQGIAFGRTSARLRSAVGHHPSPWRRLCHQWRRLVWLVTRSPKLVRRSFRARWCWTLALVVGETLGHR